MGTCSLPGKTTGTGTTKANDKVFLVVYFPGNKTALFSIGAAMRKDWQTLMVTANMNGKTAETWVGFLSNDEEDAANSTYSGNVDFNI